MERMEEISRFKKEYPDGVYDPELDVFYRNTPKENFYTAVLFMGIEGVAFVFCLHSRFHALQGTSDYLYTNKVLVALSILPTLLILWNVSEMVQYWGLTFRHLYKKQALSLKEKEHLIYLLMLLFSLIILGEFVDFSCFYVFLPIKDNSRNFLYAVGTVLGISYVWRRIPVFLNWRRKINRSKRKKRVQ